jgi:hypothetical protein
MRDMIAVYLGFTVVMDEGGRWQAYDPALDRYLTAAEVLERHELAIADLPKTVSEPSLMAGARYVDNGTGT